ncbi:hypothetical protein ACWIUD_09070 [Helicobacter sp. 23-1044]
MKADNYISFSVVVGFFIGLIISVIKFSAPELIVLWTLICTIVIYLIALLVVSFYMKFTDYESKKINIKILDSRLDFYTNEFDRRESEARNIRKYLKHNLSAINED